jgi:YggT family protein
MLDDILGIVFKTVYWLLVPAALLRFYMQWFRVPFRNPAGAFVCAMTDWLVLPLRRVIAGGQGLDWSSLVGAVLLELALAALFALITGRLAWSAPGMLAAVLLINGVFGLLTTILTLMMWITIACAVLSWVRAESAVADVLDALVAPWLKPIRRRMPMAGGFDLSPLVLIVLLQIGLLLVARGQGFALLALR